MGTQGRPTRGRVTQRRPSQVLGLPGDSTGWAPPGVRRPTGPADGGRAEAGDRAVRPTTRRRATLVVGVLTALALTTALVTSVGDASGGDRQDPAPELVTDIATEDAVVSVLQLFAAQVTLTGVASPDAGAFALPGPSGRAAALRDAAATVGSTLGALRDAEVAVGTHGRDYALDGDHDLLLEETLDVATLTDDLATLNDIHLTLLTGAGTADLRTAPAALADVVDRRPDGPLGAWAGTLQDGLDGDPSAASAAGAARDQADALWRTRAGFYSERRT